MITTRRRRRPGIRNVTAHCFDCLRNRLAEAATLVESALEPRTVTSDDVIDHIIAPIIYRAIYLPWTLTDSTAAGLVDDLFRPPRAAGK